MILTECSLYSIIGFEIGITLSGGRFYYFDNNRNSCRYYYTCKYLLLKKVCISAQWDSLLVLSFNGMQNLII